MKILSENTIIGYESQLNFFNRLIDQKNFPSCLLLTGPSMTGKATMAEYLAKKILQVENARAHPDFIWQSPGEEDALRPSIFRLLKRIHERPVLSEYLVVFLERIDEFSREASPLLLKALEDAPSYVKFILTANRAQSVLPTVRSRALIKNIPPLTTRGLMELLKKNGITEKEAEEISLLSGGRIGLAINLLNDTELKKFYSGWLVKLLNLKNITLADRSSLADEIDKEGKAEEIIDLMQAFLRNFISEKEGDNKNIIDLQQVLRRSREASAMLKSNVPARLALEYIFFIG